MRIVDSSTVFDIDILVAKDDFESIDIDLKIDLIIHKFDDLNVDDVDHDMNISLEFVQIATKNVKDFNSFLRIDLHFIEKVLSVKDLENDNKFEIAK